MPETIQRSFTSGEIAPALRSRTDLVKYATGLALCENFLIRPQGGVYSRPGTRFIAELSDSSKSGRLVPFVFNTEQTYVLVFEDKKLRFIKNGGYVLDSLGEIYEITTPYTEEELPRLMFTQSADVVTIVHPNHDPSNLNRFADDNWTITVIDYSPTVEVPNITSLSAIGSGGGGYTKSYRYVVTAVNNEGVESLASTSDSITVDSLSVTYGVRVAWGSVAEADYYRVYKAPSESSDIFGWIGDSRTTTFDDFNLAPITSDAPPEDRQPFEGDNNKPSTVSYYQQRQIFANTLNEPQTVFTSRTGQFDSLRTSNPLRDDDAITFTVASRQVNEIRHILSLDSLILLTSGGEWKVTEGQDEVLTPFTAGVKIQSYNGASWVTPVIADNTVLYVQEKGSKLRDLGYEFSSDKYSGNDLSIMSEHLFDNYLVREMAYADEPYGIVWCVRSDGVLLGLTYEREHQVWGWHKHTTDGEYESVITLNEDNRDAPYFIVKRTINGETKRYIERMEPRFDSDAVESFFVDSGLTYRGAPVTNISGLDHLEGKQVAVLSDGNEVKNLTVSNGAITLPRAASVVHVGLPYTPAIETLDIDVASSSDTLKGKKVSIARVTLEVQNSRGGFIGPKLDTQGTGQMLEIKPRFDSDQYDFIKLKTFKEEINIDPQWQKGGGLRIEQRSPLPMSILSVIPDVTVGG